MEPASDGVVIRQWGRDGSGTVGTHSGNPCPTRQDAREIVRRLSEWQQNMQVNLDWIRAHVER